MNSKLLVGLMMSLIIISILCIEVMDCVRNKTFSFRDSIKDARFNLQTRQSVVNSSLWNSFVGTVYYGMCHSFNYSDRR